MRRTFLIARQEFIKYVTRRGFAISILMFPVWIMIVTLVPQWTSGSESPRIFTVVDGTGGFYRDAIQNTLERDNESRNLEALAHYAAKYGDWRRIGPPLNSMLSHPEWASSRRDFRKSGGLNAVRAVLQSDVQPTSPPFLDPPPRFVFAQPPAALARAPGEDTIVAALHRDATPFAIDAVVVIPSGFGPGADTDAQFWATHPDADLRDFVKGALTDAVRLNMVRAAAPHLDERALLNEGAGLEQHNPSRGGSSPVDGIVPIALAIILFVVSVMNSSVLLQGVVEEKSTRMIEVLLSCATPREITTGKLIGVIAVALTTLVIWGLALLALMAIASHDTIALVFASLRAIATPGMLPLLLVYFLCGLLIYGSLFLAIGSMANSLADAQSLLGPSMLILMLPNLMIAGVIRDPNGTLASTLSWVPIYTPFFMMLRIASNPPVWQIWGTLALVIATTALMVVWTGRVFARHVLTTERPPSLGKLIGGLFGRRA
jgi:ABC-2 type transport system permease protein